MTTATIQHSRAPAQPDQGKAQPARRQPTSHPHHNVGSTERLISAVGGSVLALQGLRRADGRGVVLALLGVALANRGITGHCHVLSALGMSTAEDESGSGQRRVELQSTVTVGADPHRLFELWREPTNLPRFMTFVDEVEPLSDTRARWKLRAPLGRTIEWDAEIVSEQPGRFIAWRTVDESLVRHEGEVHFRAAPGERGTEILLRLNVEPPGGAIGAAVLSIFDGTAELKLRGDLKRFKQWIETGEIATTDGQPTGR